MVLICHDHDATVPQVIDILVVPVDLKADYLDEILDLLVF